VLEPFARLLARRAEVFAGLARRRADLERYLFVSRAAFERDVSTCPDYQRAFNGLYMVRRHRAWRNSFYQLLEAEKRNPGVAFRPVLERLAVETGRIEASFASKLVATIRPEEPVYDSFVRANLGLPVRRAPAAERIDMLCRDYQAIRDWYRVMIKDGAFAELEAGFDSHFPALAGLTRVKKLDFMFWQLGRGVAEHGGDVIASPQDPVSGSPRR
jgi:hypothetical protein